MVTAEMWISANLFVNFPTEFTVKTGCEDDEKDLTNTNNERNKHDENMKSFLVDCRR